MVTYFILEPVYITLQYLYIDLSLFFCTLQLYLYSYLHLILKKFIFTHRTYYNTVNQSQFAFHVTFLLHSLRLIFFACSMFSNQMSTFTTLVLVPLRIKLCSAKSSLQVFLKLFALRLEHVLELIPESILFV